MNKRYHNAQIGNRIYIGEFDHIRVVQTKTSEKATQSVLLNWVLPSAGFVAVCVSALVLIGN